MLSIQKKKLFPTSKVECWDVNPLEQEGRDGGDEEKDCHHRHRQQAPQHRRRHRLPTNKHAVSRPRLTKGWVPGGW